MKGLQYALGRIYSGENLLADELLAVAQRHRSEHEIHHVTRDLAAWSHRNIAKIASIAAAHDLTLSRESDPRSFADQRSAGTRPSGLLLLEDLQNLYLMASANSLAWEMLAQLGKATRQSEILQLASDSHPQTLRQLRWANTMIKTLAPQTLTSL
jgi:hypothetical protein